MKEIRYLGKLTWDQAIDRATELGMVVPDYSTMSKIIDLKTEGTKLKAMHISSTTYQWNISKYVFPSEKPIQELQSPEAVENGSKNIPRHAYAVTPGTTETDVMSGNIYFTNDEKMETKFKVGDEVYVGQIKGKIIQIDDSKTSYPIAVEMESGALEEFTIDGRFYIDFQVQLLSFTPYTFEGFTSERPIELPEVGEEVMFSDNGEDWVLRTYQSYGADGWKYITTDGRAYPYLKRLR